MLRTLFGVLMIYGIFAAFAVGAGWLIVLICEMNATS